MKNSSSISIAGAIREPGNYELKKGMTLKDLIIEAGGVKEDVYRYKIEVARVSPNNIEKDKVLRSRIFGIDSLTNLAMEYYFNDKKLTKKHYKIITALGMDNLLPEAIKANLTTLLIHVFH